MAAGVLVGFRLFPQKLHPLNVRFQVLCTAVLIFSMGVSLGKPSRLLLLPSNHGHAVPDTGSAADPSVRGSGLSPHPALFCLRQRGGFGRCLLCPAGWDRGRGSKGASGCAGRHVGQRVGRHVGRRVSWCAKKWDEAEKREAPYDLDCPGQPPCRHWLRPLALLSGDSAALFGSV